MTMLRLIFSLKQTADYVLGSAFVNGDLKSVPVGAVALSLEGAKIDDNGMLELPALHCLRCLDLDGTKITDKSLVTVARLSKLEELWLECTAVTDAGLTELHSLKSLKFVSVAYTDVTHAGIAALACAVPGIEVSV